MYRITASVGRGGTNKRPDVMTVQQLLRKFTMELIPWQSAQTTGICDQLTLGLIMEFQKRIVKMNPPTGKVEPESPTWYALNEMCGPSAPMTDLETALSLLKTEAINFGTRFINDAAIRQEYIRETEQLAKMIKEAIGVGQLTSLEGAQEANTIRNSIMEAARMRSSDLGRAQAQALKATGKSLQELEEYYAQKLFKKTFSSLFQTDKTGCGWRS